MEDFQRKETPHEIIVDILSRLPVKSLMRFRCVCKQWLSLTYDKHFINMHMKRHSGFIISYGEIVEHCRYEQNFVILSKDGTTPTDKLKFEIHSEENRVLPSCNGLICFYGCGSIYLCNPGTREIISLPPTTARAKNFSCGFGFDPLAKQYKVVKLINPTLRYPVKRRPIIDVSHCEVLTIGDESWRNIGNPPFRLFGDPVFVQGFLHWKVSHIHNTDKLIVSFDIGAETFGVIPHPECLSLQKRYTIYLLVLGGYLCILDRYFEDRNCIIELWILEDYSARTWVKERIVLPSEEKFTAAEPVAMINGEILLHTWLDTREKRLISYNLESKSFRKVDIEGQSSLDFTVSSHVESLTPILRGAI